MRKVYGFISLEVMKFLCMMGMVVGFATNRSSVFLTWTFILLGFIILKEILVDYEVRE